MDAATSKKRRLRFSMRSILIAVAIIAVLLTIGPRIYDWYYAVPTMPLADAVATFNARYGSKGVGQHEPALTEDEIVASINAQLPNLAASRQTKSIYAYIARTKRIPMDASLDAIPGWQPGNGSHFTVWWINLNVVTGKNSGYGLRIRENNDPEAKPKDEAKLNRSNLTWVSKSSPQIGSGE